jgi:hypothetical protein
VARRGGGAETAMTWRGMEMVTMRRRAEGWDDNEGGDEEEGGDNAEEGHEVNHGGGWDDNEGWDKETRMGRREQSCLALLFFCFFFFFFLTTFHVPRHNPCPRED